MWGNPSPRSLRDVLQSRVHNIRTTCDVKQKTSMRSVLVTTSMKQKLFTRVDSNGNVSLTKMTCKVVKNLEKGAIVTIVCGAIDVVAYYKSFRIFQ